MNPEEGERIVRFARAAVDGDLNGKTMNGQLKRASEEMSEIKQPLGVFVTISSYPERELKGCIGYPEPFYPLNEALTLAAIAAATEDPRFIPLDMEDLKDVIFEVTILTPPQRIEYRDPEDILKQICIGRDGLIAEKGAYKGLLLPQVPAEWGWDAEEFLSQTCIKAGLPKIESKKGEAIFYRFTGEIFAEEEPEGKVEKITPELSHR
jgi:uncharacterized protein (TIGR00296 family)